MRFVPSWLPGAAFKRRAEEYKTYFREVDRAPHDWAMERIDSGAYIDSFTSRNMRPQDTSPPDEEMEDIIKWCSSALYAGGADTVLYNSIQVVDLADNVAQTVAATTTFTLCMVLNQEAQTRAQAEIQRIVGHERLPTLDDRKDLPYVDALIKEVLRWAPPAPLGTLASLSHLLWLMLSSRTSAYCRQR